MTVTAVVAAVAAPSAASGAQIATGKRAIRLAIPGVVKQTIPGARATRVRAFCPTPADVGESTPCRGSFRAGGYRWVLGGTRAYRDDPGTIRVRIGARRSDGGARITGSATLRGPVPPETRERRGRVVLDGDTPFTPSSTWRVAFAAPFWWGSQRRDSETRSPDAFAHRYDLSRGGTCTVEIFLSARLAADPPTEREGRLIRPHEDPDGARIASRSDDDAGTTTWLLARRRTAYSGVRSGPAPPGAGPAELDTLIVSAFVAGMVERSGRRTSVGLRPKRVLAAQRRRCSRITATAADSALPRALASARLVPR